MLASCSAHKTSSWCRGSACPTGESNPSTACRQGLKVSGQMGAPKVSTQSEGAQEAACIQLSLSVDSCCCCSEV